MVKENEKANMMWIEVVHKWKVASEIHKTPSFPFPLPSAECAHLLARISQRRHTIINIHSFIHSFILTKIVEILLLRLLHVRYVWCAPTDHVLLLRSGSFDRIANVFGVH
jgi:hypothetical protein